MKTQLIFILFFVFSSALFSQYDILWEQRVGGLVSDQVKDLSVTTSGDYLVTGYGLKGNGTVGYDIYLALLSSDGNMIWENYYGGSQSETAASSIEVSDGYVFTGITRSQDGDVSHNNGWSDIWLVKLDRDGEIIWERTYGNQYYDGVYQVIGTRDGGLGLLAYLDNDSDGWRTVFMKLDKDGNVEWISDIEIDIDDDAEEIVALEVIEDQNGNFVIGGNLVSLSTFFYVGNFIVKMKNDGEIFDSQKMDLGFDCYLNNLELLSDQDVLLSLSCMSDALMVKMDSLGDEIWRQRIGGAGSDFIDDLEITSEGAMIGVGGSTSNAVGADTGNWDVLFLELNAQGDLLWHSTFGDTLIETARKIVATPDGHYLVAADYNEDIGLFKISLNATATSSLDPTSSFQLYPNPAVHNMTISVATHDLESSYIIYNNLGQTVASGKISSASSNVDVSSLATGSYTFELIKQGQSSHSQFVKL